MNRISKLVLEASYFWSGEAPEYFELVNQTPLPDKFDYDGMEAFLRENGIKEPL